MVSLLDLDRGSGLHLREALIPPPVPRSAFSPGNPFAPPSAHSLSDQSTQTTPVPPAPINHLEMVRLFTNFSQALTARFEDLFLTLQRSITERLGKHMETVRLLLDSTPSRQPSVSAVPSHAGVVALASSSVSRCAGVVPPPCGSTASPGLTAGLPVSVDSIGAAQRRDPVCLAWRRRLLEEGEEQLSLGPTFTIMDDRVYRRLQLRGRTIHQLYVPAVLRTQVMDLYHHDPLAGHLGPYKTFRRMQHLVYWPKMSRDIKHHAQRCRGCHPSRLEGQNLPGELQRTFSRLTLRPAFLQGGESVAIRQNNKQ